MIFAHYTYLIYKHKNLNTLVSIINTELIKTPSCFTLNKLSLNISKTNFIYFQSSNCFCNENLTIDKFIDNSKITRVTNTKFLGVIIQSRLTCDDHITICSKLFKNIDILVKIRYKIPSTTLTQLCHTLVQPNLEYCIIILAAGSIYL